jgi:hypothetical protein
MRRIYAFAVAIGCLVAFVFAEESFISSGGRWVVTRHVDSMTDKKTIGFHLFADGSDSDGEKPTSAHITIHCDGSSDHTAARLYPGEILAAPDNVTAYGASMYVGVRLDDKLSTEDMVVETTGAKGPVHITTGLLKKILQAKEVRLRYGIYPDESRTVLFHPAGLDRAALRQDCKLNVPGETLASVPLVEALPKD